MHVNSTVKTYDKEAVRSAINFEGYYRSELGDLITVRAGKEYKCLCPFHEEKNPSLHVYVDTGRYHCYGCGSDGDIFKFRMKRYGGSFNQAIKYFGETNGMIQQSTPKKINNVSLAPEPKIVKTYDYTDENGKLLFQSVRYDPKDFRQRRPDGKGGWINSLKNADRVFVVRLVPYNLPGIIKSKSVIIVEGEKDADNINALGLTATTSPMGAGKWEITDKETGEVKKPYNEFFKGKRVVILPDNDIPGRKHGDMVANNLKSIAESVKVVEIPGLDGTPGNKDVSDWLANGGKKEKLIEIIKTSPEYVIPIQPENTETISTASSTVSVETWPEPIPLNNYSALPSFPTESLPSPGREMVETVAKVIQVDPAIAACLYLAALSTGLGGKFRIDLKTHTEPCNLYLSPMLDSGERKTGTTSIMVAPIYQHEAQKADEMKAEVREAYNKHIIREKRLDRLRKAAAEENDSIPRMELTKQAQELSEEISKNPVPKPPRYIFGGDTTPEKLGELMTDNQERGSIIEPEGGAFDIMAGLYSQGKSNLDIYLMAHAGDPWNCHRIGRESLHMQSPALTLCLAVQSSVIREIGQQRNFRGRGLLARFLYSFCQSRVGNRTRQTESIPDSLLKEYGEHIKQFLDLPRSDKTLALAPNGQTLWDEFYNDVEHDMRPGGSLEGLKDWGSKLPGAVARVAGLLHCAENGIRAIEQPISVNIVNASAVIGGYFKEHALAIFGFMGEDPKIEKAQVILDYLLLHRPSTFQGRDVIRHKNAFKAMDDVLPGLNILSERGYIRQRVRKPAGEKGGRPEAPIYEINPYTLQNH